MIAGRTLRKHGFTHLVFLDGHFSKWRSAGLREERA
jgi:rhodanese-related sulfurtransferase